MKSRRIAVTGANGYVGSQVIDALANEGAFVLALDIREPARKLESDHLKYMISDVRDPGLDQILAEHQIDTVIHLASIVTPGKDSAREFEFSVDVTGTKNVLDACVASGVRQIIISSSGAAYGYHPDQPEWLTETDPIRGNYEFAYSWHKKLVEEMLADYRNRFPNLKQCIFRIGTVLGKTVNNQITALFEKKVMIAIRGSKSPFVFIWDQDLIQIILFAVRNQSDGIYNVAGDGALSIFEIAKRLNRPVLSIPAIVIQFALAVLKILGLTRYGPEQVNFLRYRPVLSNQALKNKLGYQPMKTSEETFEFWKSNRIQILGFLFFGLFLQNRSIAADLQIEVYDQDQKPISEVMVTRFDQVPSLKDTSDQGYPSPGKDHIANTDYTTFTNQNGKARIPILVSTKKIRFRKPGYQDAVLDPPIKQITLLRETDPFKLAAQKPANAWLGSIDFSEIQKKHPTAREQFHMQCGFCHQQGHLFTRKQRSEAEWKDLVSRMIGYGSRLPSDLQKVLPSFLSREYLELEKNPQKVQAANTWEPFLTDFEITQWAVGDTMSQIHDLLLLKNGKILLGDNIQDRVYQLDPKTGIFQVHKVPHRKTDTPGGIIAARLKTFPKHDSTSNVHSFALSEKDGHVFITPSAQRRLVEFDPNSGKFELYEMDTGLYPHTIRMDQKDRVWFTLALSNQVAQFDRITNKFRIFDLPARNMREKFITQYSYYIFKLMNWGIPISKWLNIDWQSTGVPLAYGIDITPDGKAWFARVNAGDIGSVDPDTGQIKTYSTSAIGPRRLRSDRQGNLWVVNIGSSSISKFDPKTEKFTHIPIPTNPSGTETPYALNIDHKRNVLWVTGNQTNSIWQMNMKTYQWKMIPMPLGATFTRDIEIHEDGSIYVCISNFPGWHIETGEPRLIRIRDRSLR